MRKKNNLIKNIDADIVFKREQIFEKAVNRWIDNKLLSNEERLLKLRKLESRLQEVSVAKKNRAK